jgi:hypothetical protein
MLKWQYRGWIPGSRSENKDQRSHCWSTQQSGEEEIYYVRRTAPLVACQTARFAHSSARFQDPAAALAQYHPLLLDLSPHPMFFQLSDHFLHRGDACLYISRTTRPDDGSGHRHGWTRSVRTETRASANEQSASSKINVLMDLMEKRIRALYYMIFHLLGFFLTIRLAAP